MSSWPSGGGVQAVRDGEGPTDVGGDSVHAGHHGRVHTRGQLRPARGHLAHHYRQGNQGRVSPPQHCIISRHAKKLCFACITRHT